MLVEEYGRHFIKHNGHIAFPKFIISNGMISQVDPNQFIFGDCILFPMSHGAVSHLLYPDDNKTTKEILSSIKVDKDLNTEMVFMKPDGPGSAPLPATTRSYIVTSTDSLKEPLTHLLASTVTIDEFLNKMERCCGISVELFTVISLKDLMEFLSLENRKNSQLPVRNAKSEFKTNWIK